MIHNAFYHTLSKVSLSVLSLALSSFPIEVVVVDDTWSLEDEKRVFDEAIAGLVEHHRVAIAEASEWCYDDQPLVCGDLPYAVLPDRRPVRRIFSLKPYLRSSVWFASITRLKAATLLA